MQAECWQEAITLCTKSICPILGNGCTAVQLGQIQRCSWLEMRSKFSFTSKDKAKARKGRTKVQQMDRHSKHQHQHPKHIIFPVKRQHNSNISCVWCSCLACLSLSFSLSQFSVVGSWIELSYTRHPSSARCLFDCSLPTESEREGQKWLNSPLHSNCLCHIFSLSLTHCPSFLLNVVTLVLLTVVIVIVSSRNLTHTHTHTQTRMDMDTRK